MPDPRECTVLQAGPVSTLPQVIDRLAEIRNCTGKVAPECGITHFSDLYLTITCNIWGRVQKGNVFADNNYLARLDVAFANQYLRALRDWAGGQTRPPRAWGLLFDRQNDGEILPLQLAGAGVNAHINFDLAFAVVETGRQVGDAGVEHRKADYDKVNDVFAEEMDSLLDRLRTLRAASGEGERRLSTVGRLLTEMVAAARGVAWEAAELLWPQEPDSFGWNAQRAMMDRATWALGCTLLVDLPD